MPKPLNIVLNYIDEIIKHAQNENTENTGGFSVSTPKPNPKNQGGSRGQGGSRSKKDPEEKKERFRVNPKAAFYAYPKDITAFSRYANIDVDSASAVIYSLKTLDTSPGFSKTEQDIKNAVADVNNYLNVKRDLRFSVSQYDPKNQNSMNTIYADLIRGLSAYSTPHITQREKDNLPTGANPYYKAPKNPNIHNEPNPNAPLPLLNTTPGEDEESDVIHTVNIPLGDVGRALPAKLLTDYSNPGGDLQRHEGRAKEFKQAMTAALKKLHSHSGIIMEMRMAISDNLVSPKAVKPIEPDIKAYKNIDDYYREWAQYTIKLKEIQLSTELETVRLYTNIKNILETKAGVHEFDFGKQYSNSEGYDKFIQAMSNGSLWESLGRYVNLSPLPIYGEFMFKKSADVGEIPNEGATEATVDTAYEDAKQQFRAFVYITKAISFYKNYKANMVEPKPVAETEAESVASPKIEGENKPEKVLFYLSSGLQARCYFMWGFIRRKAKKLGENRNEPKDLYDDAAMEGLLYVFRSVANKLKEELTNKRIKIDKSRIIGCNSLSIDLSELVSPGGNLTDRMLSAFRENSNFSKNELSLQKTVNEYKTKLSTEGTYDGSVDFYGEDIRNFFFNKYDLSLKTSYIGIIKDVVNSILGSQGNSKISVPRIRLYETYFDGMEPLYNIILSYYKSEGVRSLLSTLSNRGKALDSQSEINQEDIQKESQLGPISTPKKVEDPPKKQRGGGRQQGSTGTGGKKKPSQPNQQKVSKDINYFHIIQKKFRDIKSNLFRQLECYSPTTNFLQYDVNSDDKQGLIDIIDEFIRKPDEDLRMFLDHNFFKFIHQLSTGKMETSIDAPIGGSEDGTEVVDRLNDDTARTGIVPDSLKLVLEDYGDIVDRVSEEQDALAGKKKKKSDLEDVTEEQCLPVLFSFINYWENLRENPNNLFSRDTRVPYSSEQEALLSNLLSTMHKDDIHYTEYLYFRLADFYEYKDEGIAGIFFNYMVNEMRAIICDRLMINTAPTKIAKLNRLWMCVNSMLVYNPGVPIFRQKQLGYYTSPLTDTYVLSYDDQIGVTKELGMLLDTASMNIITRMRDKDPEAFEGMLERMDKIKPGFDPISILSRDLEAGAKEKDVTVNEEQIEPEAEKIEGATQ